MSDISRAMGAQNPQSVRSRGWSTRKLVVMALLVALSTILSFVEIPLFPAAPFLKYDPSAIVALLGGFALGPATGLMVGILSAVLHGLVLGDPWGTLMTSTCIICYVVPAVLIYRARPTRAFEVIALGVGVVVSVLGALGGNLLITPIYTGTDVATVAAMVLPILLPFNILKAVLNSVLVFALSTPVLKVLKG